MYYSVSITIMKDRDRIKSLQAMYSLSIQYNRKLLAIMNTFQKEDIDFFNCHFGHDMQSNFHHNTIEYKIREGNDRLFVLDTFQVSDHDDEMECIHKIEDDYIDIDEDTSKPIRYCVKCEKTFT